MSNATPTKRPSTPERRTTPVIRRNGAPPPPSPLPKEPFANGRRSVEGQSGCRPSSARHMRRSSALFSGNKTAGSTVRGGVPSLYSQPPRNPRQAACFWSQMSEDNARLAELHEERCREKGIALKPRINSEAGSRRSSRCSDGRPPSSLNCHGRRRTPLSDTRRSIGLRPDAPERNKTLNGSTKTQTKKAPQGVKQTPPPTQSQPRGKQTRPTISAKPALNGTTPADTRVRRPVDRLVQQELQRAMHQRDSPPPPQNDPGASLSTSDGIASPIKPSHRLECRTETEPFIDTTVTAANTAPPEYHFEDEEQKSTRNESEHLPSNDEDMHN